MKMFIDLGSKDINLPDFTSEFIYGKDNPNPIKSYVYGHYDHNGNIFYVGKGIRKRAWDTKNRHPFWERYVFKNLGGEYQIRIIEDDLSDEDSEYLEDKIMRVFAEQLINWINWGRKSDFTAIENFHRLRNANRLLIKKTKLNESLDLNKAIEEYRIAIDQIKSYAFIEMDSGLLRKIIKEHHEEIGYSGELEALDRLTMCLCRQKKFLEAFDATSKYFQLYKQDQTLSKAVKIIRRVNKKYTNVVS
jgi:hypothetical protein